jgi:putative ABC transport system substrate-binding protein
MTLRPTRRAFLGTLASGVLIASPAARARPAGKVYRIGWLSPGSATNNLPALDALRAGLRELGHVEGSSFAIDARWADGQIPNLSRLATELVGLQVDVICASGSLAAGAAKQATTTIPIVFANVAFPEESGLVGSYARPGGNITGVAFTGPEYGKRLELLKEANPRITRVALMYNPDNRGSVQALKETRRWARDLRLTLEPHELRGPADFEPVFAAIARARPHALMTTADPFLASYAGRIVAFAAKHRLPAMYPGREFVAAGGLMFYGGSIPEVYRRAAIYVDRILKGAKPGDLAVEEPIKFDMVINLRVAKALGLTMPQSLLLRADEVIR